MTFPFYKQLNTMDCGPTCIRIIAKYYGKHYKAETLRQKTQFSKIGVTLFGISETAEALGFRSRGVQLTVQQLKEIQLPAILHWDHNHFVVLAKVSNRKITIADPAKSIINYSYSEFKNHWISTENKDGDQLGVALLLEPTPSFYEADDEKENKISWRFITRYLIQSKAKIFQVFLALLISSLLQLIFPFLTQSIVDTGINQQNLQFVVIILIAQLTLTFSQTLVNFIQSRLLLKISNILNLQILADFWIKLTKLPVSYFEVRHTGDTLQRINDHKQIQTFLTGTALTTLFSVINFAVYAIVLIIYNVQLFIIFLCGSLLYFVWVQLFLRIRRKINYQTFHLSSKENNTTLQLIQGMQEIRMNNAEKQKRWSWESIQAAIFKLEFKSLNYNQWQSAGATLINQTQNLVISFIVAKLVIDGQLTLGAMLAVQYIIGQLSGPISQWVTFVQSAQDAKISMERLNEIHQLPNEEDSNRTYIKQLPKDTSISIKNLTFSYPGSGDELVLKNINLTIPKGKVLAIVGSSGSGKTTLLKILMKVYEQYNGEIRIGKPDNGNANENSNGVKFDSFDHALWRQSCGVVMQDGFIFNDSIAGNIAVGHDEINFDLLVQSSKIANIYSFIESLPNGFYTMLGTEGVGLSQGQKQRLLIARAVYKNPEYLFFDEATNSLDANNEKQIVENLEYFFNGKTVIIVAHRLSTVKNADKIIVLSQGEIVEEGNHKSLSELKGRYYELVKNQLELGT